MRISNSTRLLVASREARALLGDAFLLEPERTIGAMFDLCPEEASEVRVIAAGLRSPWFRTVRKRLQQNEPIDLSRLNGDQRFLAGLLNYAMELGEPAIEPTGAAAATKNSTYRLVPIGVTAAVLIAVALLIRANHSTTVKAKRSPISVAQTTPVVPVSQPDATAVEPARSAAPTTAHESGSEPPTVRGPALTHPRKNREAEQVSQPRPHPKVHRETPKPEVSRPHVKVERAEPPPGGDSSGPPP